MASGGSGFDSTTEPRLLGEDDLRHVAKLVYHELREATTPLTERELCERTLLPEEVVHRVIAELEARGLCVDQQRRKEGERPRYFARQPATA